MRPLLLLQSKYSIRGLISNRYASTSCKEVFTLKMLTKEDCQLCDEALAHIHEELPKSLLNKITIQKVDITQDGNEDLYDRWRYEIPVFYLGDKYLCKNRIDINLLLSKVKKAE